MPQFKRDVPTYASILTDLLTDAADARRPDWMRSDAILEASRIDALRIARGHHPSTKCYDTGAQA